MDGPFLYIVVSSTPSRMGHFIRRITGQDYNHISVSLDPQLLTLYSFARRYYRTPLFGGFVQETPARYCINGTTSPIEVYRIPLSDEIHRQIQHILNRMHKHEQRYLYNHLTALFFPLGIHIPVKDSYVCVDFCAKILRHAGIQIPTGQHYTIDTIRQLLSPFLHYTGYMPDSSDENSVYFSEKPLPHPTLSTLRSMVALLPRLVQK